MILRFFPLMVPLAKNASAFSGVSACFVTVQMVGIIGVV